jgi:hypothetical protein
VIAMIKVEVGDRMNRKRWKKLINRLRKTMQKLMKNKMIKNVARMGVNGGLKKWMK